MDLKRKISTCGEYVLYVFVLLWIFTKGLLGHRVYWPRRRRLGLSHQREEAEEKERREHGSNITLAPTENEEDLEANIAVPEFVDQGLSGLNTSNIPGYSAEVRTLGSDVTLTTAGEAIASARKLEGMGFSKDHVLPLYHAPPQIAQFPFLVSAAQPLQTQPPLLEAESGVLHHPRPVRQPSVATTELGFRPEDFYDVVLLEEHERATTQRLNFVKGLQYTENLGAHYSGQLVLYQENNNTLTLWNSDFRFPSLDSTLRIRPPKAKHSLKKGLSSPVLNPLLVTALDKYSVQVPPNGSATPNNDLTPSPIANNPASVTPETLPAMTHHHPPSPLPPFTNSVSGSSHSSYSSINTRTTTETSSTNLAPPLPPLPMSSSSSLSSSSSVTTEDIPIRLRRVPAWRRDPTRAKYAFGSLARGASSANVISIEPSAGIVVIEGAVESPAQEVGQSGFEVGFENMILSMGLVPASFESGLNKADGSCGSGGSQVQVEVPVQVQEGDGGKVSGNVATKGLKEKRSREAVMNDVLSWVWNSSSTS